MSIVSDSASPLPPKKEHYAHHLHENMPKDGTVTWFPSPMDGWNEESQSFSPRHEASTIELFFDLWFVANLATFTQYHAITNRYTFWSYVAFFIVLWTSWFHIVCFDARFTSDSVWERACKTVHFCAFAAFALAGYKFAPVAPNVQAATPHWIYRVLCFALLLSRAWLALQYLVTAIMCSSREHRKHRLILPLALNSLLFLCVAAVMGGLFGGFRALKSNLTDLLIGVYVVLIIEFFGTLAISMIWRKLSFKATHISERLGLLGLIIIGEGVIGTTKTIVRTMGKNGPTYAASAQIFCIICILLFMWMLYFDRVPKYRFGTVKQQIYMVLHLPFHLALLGIVEGSQQIAQATYIYYSTSILVSKARTGCIGAHLDGQALATNLTKTIEYFKLNESARGEAALEVVYKDIAKLGTLYGVCSPVNVSNTANLNPGFKLPISFDPFLARAIGAMFQSFDIDITPDGNLNGLGIAFESWVVVYTYWWSAIILLLNCYMFMRLLSNDKLGRGRWRSVKFYGALSFLFRVLMIILAVVMLSIGLAKKELYHQFIQTYIATGWILPTVVFMFWFMCLSDRAGTMWKQHKEKKYQSVAAMDGPTEQENWQSRAEEDNITGARRRGTNAYGYPAN